ncbi:MAG: MFS transporter [Kiritimatiellales bacterium]
MEKKTEPRVSPFRLIGYAFGEGAVSITMNGISNFAMLFYTQVLGLTAAHAGIALSIAMLWDAITDPVMGHITDNTRTRWGRRHPYIMWGGVMLAISFFLLWTVPAYFTSPAGIFTCILLLNLLVRTAVTVFVVPYTALGFEMCPEYVDRSRLQGVRYFFNMLINLIFGACAWSIFFKDQTGSSGERIDGTTILNNYISMSVMLSVATLVLIILCLLNTRRYAADSRQMAVHGKNVKAMFQSLSDIFKDRMAWYVFGFFGVAQLAMLLTSQSQMFTYVHYMRFSSIEKTFVHGAGMVAFALGSLSLTRLVGRLDKKPTGYIGMISCTIGGLGLLAVFIGGVVAPGQTVTIALVELPLATLIFGLFQSCWWGGCGILVPLALSMIADISEINQKKTGELKEGSYSAVFSFFLKAATSGGLLITGWLVTGAGIVSGAEMQTAAATRNMAIMTFISGPILVFVSYLILRKYPVTRAFMEKIKTGQLENAV